MAVEVTSEKLRTLRPMGSGDGLMLYVHRPMATYCWNAVLGAWVKASGEGPNFVRPNKSPEAAHGDHHG
jgi:hypothetical protein